MLKTIIRRRTAPLLFAGLLPAAALLNGPVLAPLGLGLVAAAHAQSSDAAFVQSLGNKLVTVVNGPGSLSDKKTAILPILNQDVDVDAIARTCLGRFWNTATPDQQQRYLALFHRVLVNSITDKIGDYHGVSFAVSNPTSEGGETYVPTLITRPGQPVANVQWVISRASGSPKVVDVVAEGVRLSLTQRGDYYSYLSHHGNNVGALLDAMQRQVSHNS